MAFALLIIGITLVVAAVRGTHTDLIGLVIGDFTGPGNFLFWIIAIIAVGSIGYVKTLKPISIGLLAVVLLALFLTRGKPEEKGGGGFFKKFTEALGTTTQSSLSPLSGTGRNPASGRVAATIGDVSINFPGQVSF